jgi:glucose dehydrogenase
VEQREVWRVATAGDNGGTLSTAGNLVFWGSGSRLLALDARTGAELWAAEVGRGTATPVTYSIDGVQYLSVAGGRGEADPPTVWTFRLGG